MNRKPKERKFVVKTLYSVCDQQTGQEFIRCGSDTLAEFWAERLTEICNEPSDT